MLEFKPINVKSAAKLRKYYSHCTYRLSEYSVGVKLMWKHYWHPLWAEAAGCLVVLNRIRGQQPLFDYPVPLPGVGNVEAALDEIDAWCRSNGVRPAFGVLPEEVRETVMARYPYTTVSVDRIWQDYLYRVEDLAEFVGRRYSSQRNHINKFRKTYPDARFRPITPEDGEKVEQFWEEFHRTFNKDVALAKKELCVARRIMEQVGKSWVKAGAMELDGKFIAVTLGEVCGDTLMCHVEKGLPRYEGIYPAVVQDFTQLYGSGLTWLNREDDAGDRGLRTSKLQYRPADMGRKVHLQAHNELRDLDKIPRLESARLVMDALTAGDAADYTRLCMDDERNKWWGYDYRTDLKGEVTEKYFLNVARRDFKNKLALNFAIRLDGKLIGEAILWNFDCKGEAELGCRILPEYAGQGYGAEAFAAVADWSLYELGLYRLFGKCFRENEASRKMLSACMRPTGEDETYYYFEKVV